MTQSGSGTTNERILRAGDIHLDLDKYEIVGKSKKRRIVGKERILLKLLIENSGIVVTYGKIYDALYGEDEALPSKNVFHVYVRHLRQYLEELSSTARIVTIHSVGFQLLVNDDVLSKQKQPRE